MTRTRLHTAAARLTLRQSFIPKDARPILEHTNGSALYVYESRRPSAIAFWGTAAKPLFHHSYRDEAARDAAIHAFKAKVETWLNYKQGRRAEKAAWTNPLKVGDILYTSWGYDQTNVEFFAVTRVSGRRVWVREIAADYEATHFMQGRTWPAMPIRYIGEETMHIAQPNGARGVHVKISDSRTAWPAEPRDYHTSSYA